MDLGGTKFYPRKVHLNIDTKIVVFDIWRFNGEYYFIISYIIEYSLNEPAITVISPSGRYYCVTIFVLEKLLDEAGSTRLEILMDRYFQSLIVGIKN